MMPNPYINILVPSRPSPAPPAQPRPARPGRPGRAPHRGLRDVVRAIELAADRARGAGQRPSRKAEIYDAVCIYMYIYIYIYT